MEHNSGFVSGLHLSYYITRRYSPIRSANLSKSKKLHACRYSVCFGTGAKTERDNTEKNFIVLEKRGAVQVYNEIFLEKSLFLS
jgi:hypothetical protein